MISRLFSVLLTGVLVASPVAAASRLNNASVRSTAGAEADTLIVGFTISGSGSKSVLVRGVGPTLGSFGVAGAVTDPELRLFNQAGVAIGENNDWAGVEAIATASTAVGAFALPAASLDAAIFVPLAAGTYSAHLTTRAGAGIALVEAYDTDGAASSAQITNLSARSVSAAGAGVLTVGFAIAGDAPKVVLIRATGPALTAFGVSGTLVDPQLRLVSARGSDFGQNDDWVSAAGWGAAFTAVGAFPLAGNSRDAAIVVRATDIQFADSALAAVRQWTFRPGTNAAGQTAPTIFQVPIVFTLN